ncbi:SDR family NAD(P)-dependent oxidoreductase [Neolewinella antarctica]|uniref:3-oxoacyl-[acyl-carrier protein] reductase n=1 Tax=Neolewinella antarctica TaxID=442734 RepID=A0ABX0XCT0_9BACT|nr:3-oxoacyl-ACP reductase family protein [Neolewinella antarctica]NJC26751.1 3-oxoacyl-[acyl-carrier protein] reductase [Neolewinella antarctica]
MPTLTNKIALVTGASRGIGASIAEHLAAAGATVAITYNSSTEQAEAIVKKINNAGGKAKAFQSDAGDPAANTELIQRIVDEFGGLDILVNNAGVYATGMLVGTELDILTRNYEVNVRGVYETTKAAIPQLNEGGRIINIGSVSGLKGSPGASAYGASKAAVASLTQAWAKEVGERGITVNTIHPGSVDTEMNPASGPYADMQRASNIFGRFGRPEEIASVVTFIAGPGSSFITGANIPVDGGYTA